MEKVKNALAYLEGKLRLFLELQLPALHTAWQVTSGALVAGLLASKSSADVKATVAVSVATFLAALKHYYLSSRA